MYRRTLIVALLAVIIAAVPCQPVSAAGTTQRWTDGEGVGSSVGVDGSGGANGESGSSSRPLSCTYVVLSAFDAEQANLLAIQGGLTKGEGDGLWYHQLCVTPEGTTAITDIIWVSAADPRALAEQALRYAPLPPLSISLNPPGDRDQIVRLPTWLWIDSALWRPVSATASAGGLTATTTATPTRVTWETGDGKILVCNGPGTAYDPSRSDLSQHTDCSHTFTRSSLGEPNGRFTLRATVQWGVTWTAAGGAPGAPLAGDLGGVTRSATTSVRVVEIQALNQTR